MKNKKFIFFGVVLSLFLIATVLISYDDNQYILISKTNLKSSGDLDLSDNPISIIGNSGWETSGFSGLGTPDDPYVIENVIINGNGIGNCIYIESSDVYFIIRNCTLHNSGEEYTNAGIFLYNTTNGRITNNTCYNNEMGIVFWNGCHNNTVSKNIVEYNKEGIRFDSCLLGTYDNKIFENILRFNNFGIHVDGENNVITKNHALANTDFGIVITYGTNNLVRENILENNGCGISLAFSDNNNISENNLNDGIGLHLSDNNFIIGNHITFDPWQGIYLWCSHYNIIFGNIANYNQYGIMLFGSEFNEISENTANNNDMGIVMDDWNYDNYVYDNVLINNDYYGVYLNNDNDNNIVEGNFIKDSGEYGAFIKYPTDEYNLFFENVFIGNSINAFDNGINTQWDNGYIGNYWDDYSGLDTNGDNIGDSPYYISGVANSIDHFPIWDYIPYLLDEIIEDVEELDLPGESEQSLILKLEVAQIAIENDRTYVAVHQLNAFVRQVEVMRGKKLTDEEANALISVAQLIIDNLLNNGS